MTRGRFITLEGGEGAGKSTQARLLADALRGRFNDVVLTREPGGTQDAEAIRTLLLHPEGSRWTIEAEALLFAAARADHVANLILPALESGQWVVCDRYIDSTRAYQGGGGGLSDDDLMALHQIGSHGLLPDMTLLLDVPPDVTASRIAHRDGDEADAIGGRDEAFHARVAEAFDRFAAAEPARFRRIAADGTVDQIHCRIMRALENLFGEET